MDTLPEEEGFGQFMNGMFINDSPMIEDIMCMSQQSEKYITKTDVYEKDNFLPDENLNLFDDEILDLNGKDLDIQDEKYVIEDRQITDSTASKTHYDP
jgi:hypothetical protein